MRDFSEMPLSRFDDLREENFYSRYILMLEYVQLHPEAAIVFQFSVTLMMWDLEILDFRLLM